MALTLKIIVIATGGISGSVAEDGKTMPVGGHGVVVLVFDVLGAFICVWCCITLRDVTLVWSVVLCTSASWCEVLCCLELCSASQCKVLCCLELCSASWCNVLCCLPQ